MLDRIILYSIHHKLIILLFSLGVVGFGLYSLSNIPIGAVPDVTNNQVQIITTSRNLATEDVEKFLTYPIELEMSNLPGITEIRSISKFGLSVVTVVFEDEIGTYIPRQLIAEKIKSAEEKIPAGFGAPFMGPITTGLGEIYQYVIDVDDEYKDNYTLTDIRTIQDWVIKRQLSGIPGVVEVNTWGGYLKQYEVAINPELLRSLNISVSQVFDALEKNNSVAGGGYIEKINQAYFIRGEGLVKSLEDISNIVIDNRNGKPIYVRDVAELNYGYATRFGAITGNGEGEKVLGQVMMLKGANSKAVINAVKDRVAEIETALPPGISINPFLERSELIGKTTFTIVENLVLGCLIVIFVVVLLLGNIRSGLVVASVIPMCLLFALSLMYIFGVDANLMSLGAIDFGIIIDGAVIIVEYIAFKITSQKTKLLSLPKAEQQGFINNITHEGASKMMHSAVFGQMIIIIVFIPILTLVGVEGKMFRPMALVFCFALIGAMIMCFTYVPVMASLFIKPSNTDKKTISSRLIKFLEDKYQPTMAFALRQKRLVLGLSVTLLIVTGFLFTRMGGEFVPTLDEGDFVIQPVLKTGLSLSKTVEATTQIEKILGEFPEVDQVVSRIGAAEVPTDPMSMEESDVIIKLLPRREWTSASSKDELADLFKEALEASIPGIEIEFTQPIEMRFNELITGVRADLAIKIFGEDLDILYKKALEVENAIQDIEGAADITVEKITGLPQMSVVYDRQKIAKYGLNVEELNNIISMGFAGKTAGTVFEGEKQFDLVVKYDIKHRQDIENISTASILLPSGGHLPLSEFADIKYTKGPAKISRDDTKRRIVVGVNVRNRDLESVVNDVQQVINTQINLPVGYTIEYGGQFENLNTAKKRLMVAVPIALVLIFLLLYFAFNSVKEALIIYSAIPLSAVGGVLLLYMRGLPFSISAGVGFIALFGVAVLNGIVLIEEFKELKANGVTDINKRIILGTKNRLRPVLLTASAAALGFLPMAISTSAGAEVQRPLATVVVGGLISATALTLVVLPVLYAIFDRKGKNLATSVKAPLLGLIALLFLPALGNSQTKEINLNDAIEIALANNSEVNISSQKVEQSKYAVKSGFDIPKTQFYYSVDESRLDLANETINMIGFSQSLKFPTVYTSQRKALKSQVSIMENQYLIDQTLLKKSVSEAYFTIVYWKLIQTHYQRLDSLYELADFSAKRNFELGGTNYLEKITVEAKRKEISNKVIEAEERLLQAQLNLQNWIQADFEYSISDENLSKVELTPLLISGHPGIQMYKHVVDANKKLESVQKQGLLPELHFSVFTSINGGMNQNSFSGFQIGVGIPIWFGESQSNINSAKIATKIALEEAEYYEFKLNSNYQTLQSELRNYQQTLNYYEGHGKKLSEELILHSTKAYENGEIDFLQFLQLIEQSNTIETNYLTSLLQYNLVALEANYILK